MSNEKNFSKEAECIAQAEGGDTPRIAKEREYTDLELLRNLMEWGCAFGGMTLTIHAKAVHTEADGSDIEVSAVITLNEAEVAEAFAGLDLHCPSERV